MAMREIKEETSKTFVFLPAESWQNLTQASLFYEEVSIAMPTYIYFHQNSKGKATIIYIASSLSSSSTNRGKENIFLVISFTHSMVSLATDILHQQSNTRLYMSNCTSQNMIKVQVGSIPVLERYFSHFGLHISQEGTL